MSDTIIRVENLGKKYIIGHQQEGRAAKQIPAGARYVALRDVLANGASRLLKSWGKRESNPAREEFWALKDVSFEVKQGEVIGIIGRNGAGKSTLLKVLSRITEPTTGRITIKGRVASLLEVGTGFHPELTGRENIYLNGAILGMSKAEIKKKFDEIVAFAEVEKFLDTPVKRYSSGMYVRLAFAVAAHLEPEILVVDEVLAVGDAAFQKKCLGKMGDVATKEGRTVLFVSHNMGAVSSLCSRGIVLNEGKIKVIDNTNAAIAAYMQNTNKLPSSKFLINHPNRAKSCKDLLTTFALELDNDVAYYGKPMTLRIGYNFSYPIAVPQFAVSFHTVPGVRAFSLISDYQTNNIPPSLEGKGEVVCHIHSLPLLPGSYTVSLRLWQPGQKLDDIENVAALKVEWLNREKRQLNWNNTMGIVYVDANWRLDKVEKSRKVKVNAFSIE